MQFRRWLEESTSPDDILLQLREMLKRDLPDELRKRIASLARQLEASNTNPTPQDFQRIQQDFEHFKNAFDAVTGK